MSMRRDVDGGSGRRLVGWGSKILRPSCRVIPNDHNMSTTFAKVVKSRVNQYSSLLDFGNADSSIQNPVGVWDASQTPRQGGMPTKRWIHSPVILSYYVSSISHQVKGFGRKQRDTPWGKLHCSLDRDDGREPVNFDQTIEGSADCSHRVTFLYKRFVCQLLSPSLPARGFTT